mmetsp:Transcript_11596/g.28423  ORF Transcript_11596/g.28423 Transcript_11596/m.28423 type:complete len:236 (+) Transcript_11596:259-966(+)
MGPVCSPTRTWMVRPSPSLYLDTQSTQSSAMRAARAAPSLTEQRFGQPATMNSASPIVSTLYMPCLADSTSAAWYTALSRPTSASGVMPLDRWVYDTMSVNMRVTPSYDSAYMAPLLMQRAASAGIRSRSKSRCPALDVMTAHTRPGTSTANAATSPHRPLRHAGSHVPSVGATDNIQRVPSGSLTGSDTGCVSLSPLLSELEMTWVLLGTWKPSATGLTASQHVVKSRGCTDST